MWFFKPHRVFSPAPNRTQGPPGPLCCMDFGSGKSVNAGFPEKKTGQFSGGPGKPPVTLCLLFGARAKRRWPHSTPLSAGFRTLCADIPKSRFLSAHAARHPFLSAKKGGESVRGFTPEPPGNLPAFFSGKPAGGWIPKPTHIQKGAAAPGFGVAAIFHPRVQPDPGAPGPCCMDFGSGKSVNAGFLKRKPAIFWGFGAKPPTAFCILLSPGTKGCGRAFDIFL